MAGAGISIGPEPFDSADAQVLVAALDAGLSALYPPEQRFGPNLRAEHLREGRGVFLVARQDGRAVGCGAVRLLDASRAEVKRMYVAAPSRGHGVGAAVLAALEEAARALGAGEVALETGLQQEAAIALYRRAGYVEVPCWGEYAASPSSLCFAKPL